MTIAAHVPNLFDRSRFGGRATFVETADDAEACEPSLVIVDLDRCDDPESFLAVGVRVIGFGPHVDSGAHERAVAAGYDQVLPRSVFFRRLDALLAAIVETAPPETALPETAPPETVLPETAASETAQPETS